MPGMKRDTTDAKKVPWPLAVGGLMLLALFGLMAATEGDPNPLFWFLALIGLALVVVGLLRHRT
jgi:hypothetical protein